MAKISEQKKVELLEAAVLENNIPEVKRILSELSPIEFTARALGLACRYAGAEMVSTLLDAGISFEFEPTPALKRKYNCVAAISNYTQIMTIRANSQRYLLNFTAFRRLSTEDCRNNETTSIPAGRFII